MQTAPANHSSYCSSLHLCVGEQKCVGQGIEGERGHTCELRGAADSGPRSAVRQGLMRSMYSNPLRLQCRTGGRARLPTRVYHTLELHVDRPCSTGCNCCIPLLHSLQRSRQHCARRPAGRPSWECTKSSPCSAPQPDPAHTL